jgi:hypothetical protein
MSPQRELVPHAPFLVRKFRGTKSGDRRFGFQPSASAVELRRGHYVFCTLGPFKRLDHNHVGGRDPNTSYRKEFDNAVGVHTGVLGNADPNRLSFGNVRIVLRHGSFPVKKAFSVTAKRAEKEPV